MTFNQLTNKSTKKFWERNFPKFNNLKKLDKLDKLNKLDKKIKTRIEVEIENIISELREKNNKTVREKFKTVREKFKNLNTYQLVHGMALSAYKEYFDEIKTWINNVENIVKRYEE